MANAGTGKTKVLTDRVTRLLLEGVKPERILCLTFTKAAAAEMRNRLAHQLAFGLRRGAVRVAHHHEEGPPDTNRRADRGVGFSDHARSVDEDPVSAAEIANPQAGRRGRERRVSSRDGVVVEPEAARRIAAEHQLA